MPLQQIQQPPTDGSQVPVCHSCFGGICCRWYAVACFVHCTSCLGLVAVLLSRQYICCRLNILNLGLLQAPLLMQRSSPLETGNQA